MTKLNIFAQTFHDCTSTQDFNNFFDQNSGSEELLDIMELEFAKSLSKFDKCVDSDYQEMKSSEDRNELVNSEKFENPREESTEKKEQEGEHADKGLAELKEHEEENLKEKSTEKKEQEGEHVDKELAEQKEHEEENSGRELAEQKAKGTMEDLTEKKSQKIDKPKEKSENVNYYYNKFSSQNKREKLSNNYKIVDSVASSELSGTEINEENLEDTSTIESNISEDSTEYENYQRFEKGKKQNGMIPEDIPQDDNDSVLEEQIRLAAINEKDPEKKKRLWNEYRKYKGLPQKE